MQTKAPIGVINAIVFDVVGTLLDSTEGTIAEFRSVLHGLAEEDEIFKIQQEVARQVEKRTDDISRGIGPFALETTIRHDALRDVLGERHIGIDEAQLHRLVNVGEHFQAFPDVPRQLDRFADHVAVIGLTNSTLNQVAQASARTGLRWHALLAADYAQTFKPAPAAYALVPRMLHIDPSTSVFVAAHPWDLRGAANAGFHTAYLQRPHTDVPEAEDHFDLSIESLDELLPLLERHGAPT